MGDGEGRRGFKTTKISPAKTNRWLGNSLRVAVKGEMQACTYFRYFRPNMLGLEDFTTMSAAWWLSSPVILKLDYFSSVNDATTARHPLDEENSETPQVAKVMGRKIGFERLFDRRRAVDFEGR